jgi:hypothetical protein
MLKSAVQTQLEGVRAGISQMQTAIDDVKVIQKKCVLYYIIFSHHITAWKR